MLVQFCGYIQRWFDSNYIDGIVEQSTQVKLAILPYIVHDVAHSLI